MKNYSWIFLCCLVLLLWASFYSTAAWASSPILPRTYLLVVNGQTIREKNANIRRAPASLTKIMTALVVMERCDPDDVVVVSRGAARETGSRIGLRRGERFRVRDLLAATLMASANDACRALADHTCGSQRDFVVQMNARARELHLDNTRFSNACGHDNAGLYSTAHDLATLAEKAMQKPLFAKLVRSRGMRIHTLNGNRSYYLRNKNRLIGRYPGALGVKTGTTPNAGQCLVALVERQDRKVLLVIMHARNRWSVAPAMLDAVFAAGPGRRVARSASSRIGGPMSSDNSAGSLQSDDKGVSTDGSNGGTSPPSDEDDHDDDFDGSTELLEELK